MESSRKEFVSACIIEAEVGTNTPQGGDSGHGGRTRVVLKDMGSADLTGEVHDGEIVINAGGDAEAEVLAEALIWAGEELRAIMARNREGAA